VFTHNSPNSVLSVDVLSDAVGDDIKVLSSLGGYDSRPLLFEALFISGDDVKFFQNLEGVSDETASNLSVVVSGVTVSLLVAVDLSQRANTEVSSQIYLSGDGGNSGVEPVRVFRSEFLSDTGLDVFSPLRHLDLVVLLKEFSISSDEVLGGDVLDGEASLITIGEHCDYLYVSLEKKILRIKISLSPCTLR